MHYDESLFPDYCQACEEPIVSYEPHHEARLGLPEGGWTRLAFCTDVCLSDYIEEYPSLRVLEEYFGMW